MKKEYEELKSDVRHELQNLGKLTGELQSTHTDENIATRRIIGSILQDHIIVVNRYSG